MEFRILGPVEVVDEGKTLAVGGGRQRALLAFLLLHANEVVPTDRLVDELWPGKPPATADKIVRNYVSLLRKQLGARLVRRPPGYLLRVEPGELDSEKFETLVDEARGQQPAAAAKTLRQALALWSGPPLAQVAYEPFAERAIADLAERRLQAVEDRIDADLQLGNGRELVPELEQLVGEQPLRERPTSLLMLALYRSGRQADALEVYQDARRRLVDELGLEPSPALQELQRQILSHEDALAGPKRARVDARRRKGGLMIAVGGLILLSAGIAAGAVALTRDGETASLSKVDANSVGVIDVRTNRIVGEVPVGGAPTRLALADNSLWVVNTADNSVSRIDATRRVQIRTIAVPGPPSGIAANEKAVWVVYLRSPDAGAGRGAGSAGAVLIDPRFNAVNKTVVLNQRFEYQDDIAVGLGSVWTADPAFITRLGPTGRSRKPISIDYTSQSSVDVGYGAAWAVNGLGIVRIDPSTNTPLTIPVAQTGTGRGPSPTAVAIGEGAVWVASRYIDDNVFSTSKKPGTVSRIDPETNAVVQTITVGHEPFAIATGGGAVWVANRTDFSISKIDPQTNKVVKTIKVGGRPEGLAVGDGKLWVSVG